ncbi:hypothetical protein BCS71_07065 [Vibrio lentus]|uniref:hypothetical protein n=2 Tax=Vibrio TaxID=662 RepID=UPI001F530A8F|nr:hypothetical protein [Vibrio lentus]
MIRVWFALVLLCRAAASFNKLFKNESQRSVFFIPSSGLVFMVVCGDFGIALPYTLIGYYVVGEKS